MLPYVSYFHIFKTKDLDLFLKRKKKLAGPSILCFLLSLITKLLINDYWI